MSWKEEKLAAIPDSAVINFDGARVTPYLCAIIATQLETYGCVAIVNAAVAPVAGAAAFELGKQFREFLEEKATCQQTNSAQ